MRKVREFEDFTNFGLTFLLTLLYWCSMETFQIAFPYKDWSVCHNGEKYLYRTS